MLNKDNLMVGVVGVFVGIILGAGGLTLSKRVQPAPIVIQPPVPTAQPEPTATLGPLRIFVNGAVAAPAVYEIAPDGIVQQAIEQAGGFTAEANTAVVNLALPLQDGLQIYVPTMDETADQPQLIISSPPVRSSGIELDENMAVEGSAEGEIVNINNGSIADLDTLPGIGPSTAAKIIEYRDTNGPFAIVEEIMSVSGIGPAKFEKIQDYITVGD
ncbi:hypothetical protein MNBD_CHLOROFLEXI01-1581 [hydrothermal vent metagenome]|uniref:Helix-hairpin-helix DNA-binding motif class 1 domain-containing protein n=1 Tax=hydrothermal vent metagenome TaxID=652676 RepID=A0A3B0VG27_9ZZZZ